MLSLFRFSQLESVGKRREGKEGDWELVIFSSATTYEEGTDATHKTLDGPLKLTVPQSLCQLFSPLLTQNGSNIYLLSGVGERTGRWEGGWVWRQVGHCMVEMVHNFFNKFIALLPT